MFLKKPTRFEVAKDSSHIELESKGNELISSPEGHFRIDLDIGGPNKSEWILQIQDNTGKGIKSGGKSLSAIFAEVHLPKNAPNIRGHVLARLFESSRQKLAPELSVIASAAKKR